MVKSQTPPDDSLNVKDIPGEQGRFWVNSRSRPSMIHVVDLQYSHEGQKPTPTCSCEHNQVRGKVCEHIEEAVNFERKRLGV